MVHMEARSYTKWHITVRTVVPTLSLWIFSPLASCNRLHITHFLVGFAFFCVGCICSGKCLPYGQSRDGDFPGHPPFGAVICVRCFSMIFCLTQSLYCRGVFPLLFCSIVHRTCRELALKVERISFCSIFLIFWAQGNLTCWSTSSTAPIVSL
jgi:hypothetical protein